MTNQLLAAAVEHLAVLCERQTELRADLHIAVMTAYNAVSDLEPCKPVAAPSLATANTQALIEATVASLRAAGSASTDLEELGAIAEARLVLVSALSRP